MASRSLTRETGSSYMVKFFEDNETLVVNRSRIFREGRVKIGDISQIQWGRNQTESSEGQILDVGEYTELMNKLKTPVTKPKKTVKKTVKRDASSLQQKENTPPPRKKLKSGKPAAKLLSALTPRWLQTLQIEGSASHNDDTNVEVVSIVHQAAGTTAATSTQPPTPATVTVTSTIQPPTPTTATVISTIQPPTPATATVTSTIQPPTPTTVTVTSTIQPPTPTTATVISAIQPPTPATATVTSTIQPPTPTTVTVTSTIQPPTPTTVTVTSTIQPPTPATLTVTSTIQPPTPTTATVISAIQPPTPATATVTSTIQPPTPTTVTVTSTIQPPTPTTVTVTSTKQPPTPTTATVTSTIQPPTPTTVTWAIQPPTPATATWAIQPPTPATVISAIQPPTPATATVTSALQPPTPATATVTSAISPLSSAATFDNLPTTPNSLTDDTPLPSSLLRVRINNLPDIEDVQLNSPVRNSTLFDFDSSFSELFPSPNVSEKKMTSTFDKKFDALNKKLSVMQRQLNDQGEKLNYIIQMLGGLLPLINQRTPFLNLLNDTGLNDFEPPTQTCDFRPNDSSGQTPSVSSDLQNQMPSIPYAQPPVIHQESGNFSDIPVPHRLSVDELTKLKENSQSVGNFACNLTRRLYPELFGPDNLRKKFNYRGEKKTELDPQRKTYLQRYILYFFPEVRDNKAWQRKVINPINEVLRR